MPLLAVENTIAPSDQLAPNGGYEGHNLSGAPAVTATLLSVPSPLVASKNARQRPSGEKTGLSAPAVIAPSNDPLMICRVRLSAIVWRKRPAPVPKANADPSGDIANTC